MKKRIVLTAILALLVLPAIAAAQKDGARFSHTGIKAAVGLGGFETEFAVLGDKMQEGEALSLGLGYGFSPKFTLWASLMGVSYPGGDINRQEAGFIAGELTGQYRFSPDARLQPYVRFGLGLYGVGEEGDIYVGPGLALGLGANFFLNPHVALGAEIRHSSPSFSHRSRTVNGQEFVTTLDPPIEGKTGGLLLTLTLQ